MADYRERSRSRERAAPEENGTKLYIGNLSYDTRDEDLEGAFSKYGEVASAQVITDRDTGRSRGFGFVTFNNKDDAEAAIDAMNGKDLQGRQITVNVARKRGDGPSGGRGGRGGGFRGGRGGDREDRPRYDRGGDRREYGGERRGRDRDDDRGRW